MVEIWFAKLHRASIFIGWSPKVLRVRLACARAFRRARRPFAGVIPRECVAVAFRGILTLVLAAMGAEWKVIAVL